jgi:hypothetical protein
MAAPRPPVYAEPDLLVVQRTPQPTAEPTTQPTAQPTAAPVVTPDPPLVLVEHRLEIVESGSFARAVCSGCSWTGPARRSRAVAAADAEQHPAPSGS